MLEKGWGLPEIGAPPTFWPFMVSLGTVLASVSMPCGACVI